MIKIPAEPRLVEYARIPGLSDALAKLRAKAQTLNEMQADKPEGQREEFTVQIGMDCLELRAVKILTVQEDPKEGQRLLQETAERIIKDHQKAQESKYRKVLQDLLDGKITLDRAHELLPEHHIRELYNIRKQLEAEVQK